MVQPETEEMKQAKWDKAENKDGPKEADVEGEEKAAGEKTEGAAAEVPAE